VTAKHGDIKSSKRSINSNGAGVVLNDSESMAASSNNNQL